LNLYAYVGNSPVNWLDPLGLMPWYDHLLQGSADFSAGFGDFITGGLTNQFRENFGWNDNVNQCSKSYNAGEWTGLAWDVAFTAATIAEAAGYEVVIRVGYKKVGGGGVTFYKNGKRIATADWHRLPEGNFKGAGKSVPHYHRRPGIGKHRPWQGGW
jgi:hypothetical protein